MKSNYELWLQECEKKKNELYLLERYEDKKNVVKLFKVVEKYEYKHNFYNKVVYCLWINDKVRVYLEYQLAYSAFSKVVSSIQKGVL